MIVTLGLRRGRTFDGILAAVVKGPLTVVIRSAIDSVSVCGGIRFDRWMTLEPAGWHERNQMQSVG
jgi:hypothetical protein